MSKRILTFSVVLMLAGSVVFAEDAATPTMRYEVTSDRPVEAFGDFCAQLATLFGDGYARTVEVQFIANSTDGSNSTSIMGKCPQNTE